MCKINQQGCLQGNNVVANELRHRWLLFSDLEQLDVREHVSFIMPELLIRFHSFFPAKVFILGLMRRNHI